MAREGHCPVVGLRARLRERADMADSVFAWVCKYWAHSSGHLAEILHTRLDLASHI